jgi:hypothetical protein
LRQAAVIDGRQERRERQLEGRRLAALVPEIGSPSERRFGSRSIAGARRRPSALALLITVVTTLSRLLSRFALLIGIEAGLLGRRTFRLAPCFAVAC